MKAKKLLIPMSTICCLFVFVSVCISQSQIQISGTYPENQGMVYWNTGSAGAEPQASGHIIPWAEYGEMFYYGASRDYVQPPDYGGPEPAGFHFTGDVTGFPLFAEALAAAGYEPENMTAVCGLSVLGEDTEGDDWFIIDDSHFSNYYGMNCTFYLSGYPILTCVFPYHVVGFSNGEYLMESETAFAQVSKVQTFLPPVIAGIAEAFLTDLSGLEIRLKMQLTPFAGFLYENGRRGFYFDATGILETGKPKLPLSGLLDEHLGFAAWNADGTGAEPKRTGHELQGCQSFYYLASRDYDQIDPSPEAALSGIVAEGAEGFQNLKLQLAYRGFTADQLKLTMGLADVDEDIENEDWSIAGNVNSSNYYHSWIKISLNGEPFIGMVFDTLFSIVNLAESTPERNIGSAAAFVYDATSGSSDAVKMVARSFFRDIGQRHMKVDIMSSLASAGVINSGGRCGAFWQVNQGELSAIRGTGSMVEAGDVSGTWGLAGHPYYVNGEITIPDGQTLTIEPGVWVKFTNRYRFNVNGRILAEGTADNTGGIVFTAADPGRGWGHLVLNDIAETNGQSRFTNCLFENGYAAVEPELRGSGAISIKNSNNIVIDHCIFRNNEARTQIGERPNGGAIGISNSSPFIGHSEFYGNSAMYGGAIDMDMNSSPMISRCLFYDNLAVVCGGALVINKQCNPDLVNNTIAFNKTNHFGGGIIVADNSNPVMINNILWGNTGSVGSQISVKTSNCNLYISYCDVQYGLKDIQPYGIGNGTFERSLLLDPLFMDEAANNYLLDSIAPSSCINAGNPYLPPDPDGSCSDMGAYSQTIAGITTSQPVFLREARFSPNPFIDLTSLTFNLPENPGVEIGIYNSLGTLVYGPEKLSGKSGDYRFVWNAKGQPAGIYLVRITFGEKEMIRKIVKVR